MLDGDISFEDHAFITSFFLILQNPCVCILGRKG